MVITLAFIAGMVLIVGRFGERAVDASRARAAADAAALAGAVGGREAAEEFAHRNGGELIDFHDDATTVDVRVRINAVEATSRAERAWAGVESAKWPPPPTTSSTTRRAP